MSPTVIFICYLIAVVSFGLYTMKVSTPYINILGLGLLSAFLPTFWAAMQAL